MPKKVDLQKVKAELAVRGIRLISDYRGMNKYATFECNYRHTWRANPQNVYHKGKGCPECHGNARLSREKVNQRLFERESDLRQIGPYKNNATKAAFVCLRCGIMRSIAPASALNGYGCARCAGNQKLVLEAIKSKIEGRGIFVCEAPKNARTPIKFGCQCGNTWWASPDNVQRGTGCPRCARYGFDPSKSATLYYVMVDHPKAGRLWKIGVTNKDLWNRFAKSEHKYLTPILTLPFRRGSEALEAEMAVKTANKNHQWQGERVLKLRGDTELFTRDIFVSVCETLKRRLDKAN